MKLYLTPGACSLSDHIALNEAGFTFDIARVDLPTRRTEHGDDYTTVNPKGYVPALALDTGETLTENAAILLWVAEQTPQLIPEGSLGKVRLVEALAFISSELHKPFIRYFFPACDEDKTAAGEMIRGRLDYLGERLTGDFLFGSRISAADPFLYVMLTWARDSQFDLPAPLSAFLERMTARPAVAKALQREGLA